MEGTIRSFLLLALAAAASSTPAKGQDEQEKSREPLRTKVVLGPQLVPGYPGSGEVSLGPLIEVARARGGQFEFEAPDESFGFPLLNSDGFAVGPAVGFQGARGTQDAGALLPKVPFTFELGAFVQYKLSEPVRARLEVRRGLGGHEGWLGTLSADYIWRDKDRWLFSIGPRVTFADDRYSQAYFGLSPADAAGAGLPSFSADGGLQSLGVASLFSHQLTPRWGIYTYGKYDRLIGDAGSSPIVRQLGSRHQVSGGVALSYTFGATNAGKRAEPANGPK